MTDTKKGHKVAPISYHGPDLLTHLLAASFVRVLPIAIYEFPEVLEAIGLFMLSSLRGSSPQRYPPWSTH